MILSIYISSESREKIAKITRKYHVINDLDCEILINNDIIASKQIDIFIFKKKTFIDNCQFIASFKVISRIKITNHIVKTTITITISANTIYRISIHFVNLKNNQNYLFKSYSHHAYLFNNIYVLQCVVSSKQNS